MTENQLKAFIDKAEQIPDLQKQLESGALDLTQASNPAGFKLTNKGAKEDFHEMKRFTQEDQTNMPPLVVLIMAYLNILFPDSTEIVDV